ncbi:MAG: type II toxin-antitoxin system RelE/ParE family toxin [Janthinobacterium lividum]
MTYRISKPATADLGDIRDWIAKGDPKRAVSYLEELDALFGRISVRPLIGRPREEIGRGGRSIVHHSHVVFYRQVGTSIEISRVIHGRRNLGRVLV